MLKRFLSVNLAFAMTLSLVACGGKEAEPAAKEETKKEAVQETKAPAAASAKKDTFHLMTFDPLQLNDTALNEDKALIAFYESLEEKYPDVEFVFESVSSDDYENKLKAYILAGDVPDFFTVKAGLLSEMVAADMITPLNDALEADPEWADKIVESMLNEYKIGDVYAGIPGVGGGCGTLYYRKSALKEVGYDTMPADWDGFMELCQALKDNGQIPLVYANSGKSMVPSCTLNTLAYRWVDGDWYYTLKNYEEGASFTDPEMKAATEALLSLWENGYVNSDYATLQSTNDTFLGKHAAMTIDGYWKIGVWVRLGSENPEIQAVVDDIGIAHIPCPAGYEANAKNQASSSGWGWAIGGNASEREVEIALDIMKWRTGEEMVGAQVESAMVPIVDYVALGYDYDESMISPLWSDYLEFYNTCDILPVWDCELSPAFQEVFYNDMADVLAGTTSVDDYLADLQAAHESMKPQ